MRIISIVVFIVLHLQIFAQISGVVVDENNSPVVNALVSHSADAYKYTKTGADGTFTIEGSQTTELTVAALFYETKKSIIPAHLTEGTIHLDADSLLKSDVYHISFDHLRPGASYSKEELKDDFPVGYGKGFYESNDPSTDRAFIDPEMDFSGDGRSLRVLYPAGKVKTGESGVDTRIPLGGKFNDNTFAADELYLSYWMRFSDNFDMDACGGKLPSLGGSDAFMRENEWKGRIMWGTGGSIRFYMELPHDADGIASDSIRFWGDKIHNGGDICTNRFTPYLDNTQWHQIELHYKLESDGQPGLFEGWIDGNKAHEIIDSKEFGLYRRPGENMDNLTINAILISSFLGGGAGWEQDEDVYAWFDEFRVSTQRIGTDVNPPPTPPVVQTIELKAGWNLVSLYVEAVDMSVGSVFTNAQIVKDAGSFYAAGGAAPAYLNSLKTLKIGIGYMVYNSVTETIEVTGTSSQGVTQSHPLTSNNWNLVGITENISVESFIIASGATAIKDLDGFWEAENALSTITELRAGKAYFISK